jgi:hypothetical protein
VALFDIRDKAVGLPQLSSGIVGVMSAMENRRGGREEIIGLSRSLSCSQ